MEFVTKWRTKRFCTCTYIRTALKLKVDRKTVGNVLNRHGFFWRPAPKVRGLSEQELEKRKAFVEQYSDKTAAWWEKNMNVVLDGVTLTLPPKPLNGRQRHMAQSIKQMWMKDNERMDNEAHTFNRYGV